MARYFAFRFSNDVKGALRSSIFVVSYRTISSSFFCVAELFVSLYSMIRVRVPESVGLFLEHLFLVPTCELTRAWVGTF